MLKQDFYGNDYKWFTGIVADETTESRVRVRIFGIHPFDEQFGETGSAKVAVSDGDLPWASIVYPVDSTIKNHDLKPGDWVSGFFADGDSCQQPVIIGRIAKADGSTGTSFTGGGTTSTPGTSAPGSDPGAGNLNTSDTPPSKKNSSKYYDVIPGGSNQQKAFNLYATYFEEKGVDTERAKRLAAGVVASLIGESGTNLNTTALGDTNTSSYAWGVAQWRLGRREGLFQMCGHKTGNLVCQLNFSIAELENRGHGVKSENSHDHVLGHLLRSSTPYDAAYNWTVYYEIPADRFAKGRQRASTADAVYKRLAPSFERAKISGLVS